MEGKLSDNIFLIFLNVLIISSLVLSTDYKAEKNTLSELVKIQRGSMDDLNFIFIDRSFLLKVQIRIYDGLTSIEITCQLATLFLE